ncbi:hypothetical protein QFZ31_000251 [Neobacillus niacini]|nr:hypothetical protein [Neobacillus niacini]MDQ0970373.1 hypothetical protein [Neobacillus niacini]
MTGFIQGLYRLSEFSLPLVVLNIKVKVPFIKNVFDLEVTVQEYEV